MRRRRFFVPQESIRDGAAYLPSDQTHHLRNVLRLQSGDAVEIFDGRGNGYAGEVEFGDAGAFIRKLHPIPASEPGVRLILAAALIKPARYEWILQKSTELGVHEIIPLKTQRSEIDVSAGRIAGRMQRWQRIVLEAAKQSRRSLAPSIHEPLAFPDLLAMKELSRYRRFMLYEKAPDPWHPDPLALSCGVVLCIGPEGGWEEGEVSQAAAAGYEAFSLGGLILRTETAAIAAVSIVQHYVNLLNARSPSSAAGSEA